MRSNFQIGIIGKGSQFKRVSKILNRLNLKYYLYKPNNKKYYDKHQFIKLKKCKYIFILSPNKSHFYYVKTLHKIDTFFVKSHLQIQKRFCKN